jgi:Tfp pilus assembly protein FimV
MYTVQSGDTLADIAAALWGDASATAVAFSA